MSIERAIQDSADAMRVLRAGLRGHDPEIVRVAHARISKSVGEERATEIVLKTITHLMSDENWSFLDKDGNPFPLLGGF